MLILWRLLAVSVTLLSNLILFLVDRIYSLREKVTTSMVIEWKFTCMCTAYQTDPHGKNKDTRQDFHFFSHRMGRYKN